MTSCEGRDFCRFRDFSRPCVKENFPPRPATCFRPMRRIPVIGVGQALVRDQRRGAVGGGGIKAASKAFLQAFPNLACLCPSFSKQTFGHFVGFQWVTRVKNQKVPLPNFFVPPASIQPYSRRRPAVFPRAHGEWRPVRSAGGRRRLRRTKWGAFMAAGVIRIERISNLARIQVYGKRYQSFSRRPASFGKASVESGISPPVVTGRGWGGRLSVARTGMTPEKTRRL